MMYYSIDIINLVFTLLKNKTTLNQTKTKQQNVRVGQLQETFF